MSLETHLCISLSTQTYPLASIQMTYWEGEKKFSCSCLEKWFCTLPWLQKRDQSYIFGTALIVIA